MEPELVGAARQRFQFHERMTAEALRCADHVSVRDMESFLRVVGLTKGKTNPRLSADPAFLYPQLKTSKDHLLSRGVRYVAIALKGRKYNPALALGLNKLCKMGGLLPVFVPMDAKNDTAVCKKAAAECGGLVAEISEISELEIILGGARMAIGERLHFLIFAFKNGVPVIPISADPKIDAFSFEVFGEEGIDVRRKSGEKIFSELEKFIAENHRNFDKKAHATAVKAFADRVRSDIKAISQICLSKKCNKGVEKK